MKVLKSAPRGVLDPDWDKAWEDVPMAKKADVVPPGWLTIKQMEEKFGLGRCTMAKWLKNNVGKTVERQVFRVRRFHQVMACAHYRPIVKKTKQ